MTLLKVQIPLTVVVEVPDCQGPLGYPGIGNAVKDAVKDLLHDGLPTTPIPSCRRVEGLEWGRVEVSEKQD